MLRILLALALAQPGTTAPTTRSRPAAEAAERALAAWERGDYQTAREEIENAYMLESWAEYLYARAQIERAAGRCGDAITFYRRYLASEPPDKAAKASRRAIRECEEEIASPHPQAPPPEPVPPVADMRARPTTLDRSPPPEAPPWWRDAWGGALVGTGSGIAVIGVGVYGGAVALRNSARDATDEATFADRAQRARTMSAVGIAGLSLGGALIVAGIVRWVVVARRGNRATKRAAQ